MRVAAVAIVLIVGAAVVLWFANTLNSWVVGGLIGGLAALLLSIPISLTLFSFLARRHDEQFVAVGEEEMSLARSYEYADAAGFAAVYESDVSMLPPEQERYEQPNERPMPVVRNLPAPVYARLPAAGQTQRSMNYSSNQQAQTGPVSRRKSASTQHLESDQRPYYPGLLGYRGNSPYSQHRSSALRTARLEAVQGRKGSNGTTSNLKRPTGAINRASTYPAGAINRAPTGQLPEQKTYQARPRRTVDANSFAQSNPRRQVAEHQTEGLRGQYPQTGPIRQQPRMGRVARTVELNGQDHDSEINTGSLRNPLVRRPPYMYEDDPLRQELAQQIEAPIVRRSSRYVEE